MDGSFRLIAYLAGAVALLLAGWGLFVVGASILWGRHGLIWWGLGLVLGGSLMFEFTYRTLRRAR